MWRSCTIRHEAIQNLEMPPMTMVFQVSDLAMLDQVKVADKVQFSAEKPGSAFTITQIQLAQ